MKAIMATAIMVVVTAVATAAIVRVAFSAACSAIDPLVQRSLRRYSGAAHRRNSMGGRFSVALGAVVIAFLAVSPAAAQRKTHGAGVSWSGSRGHAYEGGSYGGYPAASSPPPPPHKAPQISPSRTELPVAQRERRDDRRAMRRPVQRAPH